MGFREYARYRSVSLATVQRKIKRGIVVVVETSKGKKIDVATSDNNWETLSRFTISNRTAPSARAGSKYNAKYMKAKADCEELKAKLAELKLGEKQGKYIQADLVKSQIFKHAHNFKSQLFNIPSQLGPDLLAAKTLTELKKILSDELERVLTELEQGMCKIGQNPDD